MKVLIEGENLQNYFAKVHEAWRKGFRAMFDTRCFGRGYPDYDANITSFVEMKEHLFGKD